MTEPVGGREGDRREVASAAAALEGPETSTARGSVTEAVADETPLGVRAMRAARGVGTVGRLETAASPDGFSTLRSHAPGCSSERAGRTRGEGSGS